MNTSQQDTYPLFRFAELEEIIDFIGEMQFSFGIELDEQDHSGIKTFGQLCDLIQAKIRGRSVADCTHQQAFYKLRDALSAATDRNTGGIRPATRLRSLIPLIGRRKIAQQVDDRLGFMIHLLTTSRAALAFGGIGLVVGIVLLFYFFIPGLIVILLAIQGGRVLNRLFPDLAVKTVGELARKITMENYRDARRDPQTINPQEIEGVLKDLMVTRLGIDRGRIHWDSEF